jgi:hypothetical protein
MMGTNDLDNLARAERFKKGTGGCERVAEQLVKYANEMTDATMGVWIVVPLPRRAVPEKLREEFQNHLLRILNESNSPIRMINLIGQQYAENFIRISLDSDGVHPLNEEGPELMRDILHHMGLRHTFEEDNKLKYDEYLPTWACWTCGGKHIRGETSCKEFGRCCRCGSDGHDSEVCLAIPRMCSRCGRREHTAEMCQ